MRILIISLVLTITFANFLPAVESDDWTGHLNTQNPDTNTEDYPGNAIFGEGDENTGTEPEGPSEADDPAPE